MYVRHQQEGENGRTCMYTGKNASIETLIFFHQQQLSSLQSLCSRFIDNCLWLPFVLV